MQWLVEATQMSATVKRTAMFTYARIKERFTGQRKTLLSGELSRILGEGVLSRSSLPLLAMGRDIPDGRLYLNDGNSKWMDGTWTTKTSLRYFDHVKAQMGKISDALHGHMIELSANGALFAELAAIADINDRRANGEEVLGSSEPIVLHVVKPDLPLPLDPDFVAGRISAEALVAMGYRDAWRYLSARSAAGVPLDVSATRMRVAPLGCRISLRARGSFGGGGNRLVASTIIEVADLSEFVADPGRGVGVVGGIETSDWGYRPFVGGSVTVTAVDAGRLVELDATIRVDDENARFVMSTILPKGGSSRSCWRAIRTWSFTVFAANGGGSGTAHLTGLDALRVLYMFEPSGAHTLSDRLRALLMMARFVRSDRRR